jgi:uncharacterized membrane protein YfcA
MPDLSVTHWLLAAIAAVGIGVAKAGFAGVSLLYVVIFAFLFGARESSGIVLPLLLIGDLGAIRYFRQHARWDYVRRMLPPAIVGIVIGTLLMGRLDEASFRPTIGAIILALTALQLLRLAKPGWFGAVPHAWWFAWMMGILAGITSMLANASGPIIALYTLAVGLPKLEFVGTNAWFFMIVNAIKVPFSLSLGLIHANTLLLNVALAPAIALGVWAGRWATHRIPQRAFDTLLLVFAAAAALRLIGAL